MSQTERNEEAGRALLLIPQMVSWFYLMKLIPQVRTHWGGVLNYQAHSVHPSLPLGVQDSEHMMMIGVRPHNTRKLWTHS